ncbi:glycosyltransferase family 2 protein [Gordonia sp. SCSIO 19800]|uniref:glycosyltransferase family 2 protein n=1 Tax=Gordonia sp. SCSIO 19800 TaxID=2826926 RepID=UPI001B8318EC|nr:glycosyltransferase family 2 protein [Gordonia sp. SCSIO 19800]MBR7191550.1 glycosyltransferase [Gordonia sp. SCSIO 19800]
MTLITVTFRDRSGLIDTCQSIFKQQIRADDFEHIVVDGGSNDGSREWYLDNRPKAGNFAIISESDGGIYDAMNKGIGLASGDFVCFLNSGDVFHDDLALGFVASKLEEGDADWSYGRANIVDARGEKVRPAVGVLPYSLRRHLLGRAVICHQAVWMRRALLEELGGFDERFGAAADYHLLLRAAAVSMPHAWDRILVDYLAGGVSDTDVYRQLLRRHRARVDAMRYGNLAASLDWCWTAGQVPYIALRKSAKRLVGGARTS